MSSRELVAKLEQDFRDVAVAEAAKEALKASQKAAKKSAAAEKRAAAKATAGPSKSEIKQACADRIRSMRVQLKWSGAEWSKDFTPEQLKQRCQSLIEQATATMEFVDSLDAPAPAADAS